VSVLEALAGILEQALAQIVWVLPRLGLAPESQLLPLADAALNGCSREPSLQRVLVLFIVGHPRALFALEDAHALVLALDKVCVVEEGLGAVHLDGRLATDFDFPEVKVFVGGDFPLALAQSPEVPLVVVVELPLVR